MELKIKLNNLRNKRAIVGFEILTLIIASFAFSYIIYQSSGLVDEIRGDINKKNLENNAEKNLKSYDKNSFNLFEFVLEEFRKPLFSLVKAEEISLKCCEKTKKNETCSDVLNKDECSNNFQISETKCEKTSFCKLGCCVNESEGTYDKNTPKNLCEAKKGKWVDDKNCNIPEARAGCCVLGQTTSLVTDGKCSKLSELYGVEKNFKPNMDEIQCISLSQTQELGACVYSERSCKITTQQECLSSKSSQKNNFHKGYLCTALELNTTCKKTEQTTCVEGKDEVYFIDSCGNPANIYDSSKINNEDYWTKIYSGDSLCNSNDKSGNANSKTCGNCNRFLGGICANAKNESVKPEKGDFICKSTSCKFKGEDYRNGESWCVYDGKIGQGDDVAGSRHWKYVCSDGEVLVEPCADFRNGICVQQDTLIDESTKETFSNANCMINNWRECIELNTKKEKISECGKKPDCYLKHINVDEGFSFDVCLPSYPPGFELSNEAENDEASKICSLATGKCTVIYEKKLFSGWTCVLNCDCEKAGFAQQMNDFCKSVGDCGGYVNIAGEYTDDGYSVSRSPKLSQASIDNYKKNANVENFKGQIAKPGNYTDYLIAAGLLSSSNLQEPKYPQGGQGITNAVGLIGAGVAGGGGVMVLIGGPLHAFGIAALAAGAALIASYLSIKLLGLRGDAALAVAVAGAVGATAGVIVAEYTSGLIGGIVGVGIVIIVAALMKIFGIGKIKKVIVTFTCEPWQAPVGGKDCEKCNNELLKPCSEYRCQSLGQACELINKGAKEERCIWNNKNDVTPPKLSPMLSVISEGLLYKDVSEKGFKIEKQNATCVDAYTNLIFGVETNENAQCKYDLEMKNFEFMEFSLGTNSFVENHTISYFLPDPSHGQSLGSNWTGKSEFYVKCRDVNGNEIPYFYDIKMCVNQGPDLTPPLIRYIEPETNSLIGWNTTSKDVSIFTNEPADCKWSLDKDKPYELIENNFSCLNDFEDATAYGFLCNATLSVSSESNIYYFKCKDQPWLSAPDENGTINEEQAKKRNANQESFEYKLNRVKEKLKIDKIVPSEDFEASTPVSSVLLRVGTSGGAPKPWCSYSFDSYENMITMFNTYSNLHEQELNLIYGEKKVFIECVDETGDSDRKESEFEIIFDDSPPDIARVYTLGDKIKIITTEKADCRYSTDEGKKCDFDFNKGNSMGGLVLEHSITNEKNLYYIKCKDEFGHISESCSVIVQPD